VPAPVVCHSGGIVERIGIAQERFSAFAMAQDEMLVEPGDVADLPEQRIDDVEPRPNKLLRRQPGNEGESAATAVP